MIIVEALKKNDINRSVWALLPAMTVTITLTLTSGATKKPSLRKATYLFLGKKTR